MTTETEEFATFAERTLRDDPNAFIANLPIDVLAALRNDDPSGVLYELVCQEMWPTFILWACKNEEICTRFTAATGMPFARNTKIEAITDYRNALMDQFVEWVTTEIYGIECAPAAYREKMARKGRL